MFTPTKAKIKGMANLRLREVLSSFYIMQLFQSQRFIRTQVLNVKTISYFFRKFKGLLKVYQCIFQKINHQQSAPGYMTVARQLKCRL